MDSRHNIAASQQANRQTNTRGDEMGEAEKFVTARHSTAWPGWRSIHKYTPARFAKRIVIAFFVVYAAGDTDVSSVTSTHDKREAIASPSSTLAMSAGKPMVRLAPAELSDAASTANTVPATTETASPQQEQHVEQEQQRQQQRQGSRLT